MLSIWLVMPASSRIVAVEPRADLDRVAGDAPEPHGDAPGRRVAALQQDQVAVRQEARARYVEVVVPHDRERAHAGDPAGNVGLAARRPLGDRDDLAGERRGGAAR